MNKWLKKIGQSFSKKDEEKNKKPTPVVEQKEIKDKKPTPAVEQEEIKDKEPIPTVAKVEATTTQKNKKNWSIFFKKR